MTHRGTAKVQWRHIRAGGRHPAPLSRPTVIATSVAFAFSGIPHALAEWKPNVEVLARPGDERAYLGVDGVLPLWQSGRSLLLADLKARLAEDDVNEFNLGLAFRRFTDSQRWVLGGYAAFDHRRTSARSDFGQATLGAEALSENWDFRLNYYHPVTNKQMVGLGVAQFQGFGIFRTGDRYEEAMRGADFEVGRLLPFSGKIETRAFLAGYKFEAKDLGATADGARVRVEVRPRQDVILGLSVQHDNLFKTAWFAEVRYAFGKAPVQNVRKLTDRMTDPWTRDIDVRMTPPMETGVPQQLPGTVVHVDSSKPAGGDGSYERPYNQFATCEAAKCVDPAYDLIRLWKGNSDTTPYTQISLVPGKTLWGEGVNIFTGAASPALQPKIAVATGPAITLANNVTVAGVNARASAGYAVYGRDLSGNIAIRDSTLSAGSGGILIRDTGAAGSLSSSIAITRNRILFAQAIHANAGIHIENGHDALQAGFTRAQTVTISANTLESPATGQSGRAVNVFNLANRGSAVQRVTVSDNSAAGTMGVGNYSGSGGSAVQTAVISRNTLMAGGIWPFGIGVSNRSERGRSTQSLVLSSNNVNVSSSQAVSVGNTYLTGGSPAGSGFSRQIATLTGNTFRAGVYSPGGNVSNSGVNATQNATLAGNTIVAIGGQVGLFAISGADVGTGSQVLTFRGNTISTSGPGLMLQTRGYFPTANPIQAVTLSGDTISAALAVIIQRGAGSLNVRFDGVTLNSTPRVVVNGGAACSGAGVPACP